MSQNKTVRVIKQAARKQTETQPARADGGAKTEREMRTVVSGWVREQQGHAEEFRRNFTTLLREYGFNPPRASSRG
ncbi:MAG: hypothetical protein WCD76_14295 [Pyrinomonadaceae bacterium]